MHGMECMWLWIYKFCPVISSYLLIEIYITISYNQSTHTISTHKQNWFSKRKADQNPELNKTPVLFHKLTKKTTQYLHSQYLWVPMIYERKTNVRKRMISICRYMQPPTWVILKKMPTKSILRSQFICKKFNLKLIYPR